MKLLDELKTVKLETPRNALNVSKFYAKLNELASKLNSVNLLTPDSLALYFFIRGFANQYKQTFESMQEQYRDQPQGCPTMIEVWQRVTRAIHMGENPTQEARPSIRGRHTATNEPPATLNALSSNPRKRQSQDSPSDESFKRQRGNFRRSFQRRETENDWASFSTCRDCKMRHPRENTDVCWYLHPDQANSWFNKVKAAERLREFRKNNPGS